MRTESSAAWTTCSSPTARSSRRQAPTTRRSRSWRPRCATPAVCSAYRHPATGPSRLQPVTWLTPERPGGSPSSGSQRWLRGSLPNEGFTDDGRARSVADRDLDALGASLVGDRAERLSPGTQREHVRQHPGEVHPGVLHQVEVVLDRMLSAALD